MAISMVGLDPRTLYVCSQLQRVIAGQQDEINQLKLLIKQLRSQIAPAPIVTMPATPTIISVSADFSLSQDELNTAYEITCTSACAMTLPTAVEGLWISAFNNGSANLSIKVGSTTTCVVLRPNMSCFIKAVVDGSNVPAWPSVVNPIGQDGTIYAVANVVIDSTTAAVYQKSSDGHYYQLTMSTSGRLVTTDQGTSVPVISSAQSTYA